MLLDHPLAAFRHRLASVGVLQHARRFLHGRGRDDDSPARLKRRDHFREVLVVGADEGRTSGGDRRNGVRPAHRHEAPAHDRDIREGVRQLQLAHGVEQEEVGGGGGGGAGRGGAGRGGSVGIRWRVPPAAAADFGAEGGDGIEPLRPAGHQQQLGRGGTGGDQLLFLSRTGRSGDDERAGPVDAQRGGQLLDPGAGSGAAGGVPLHGVGHLHPCGRGAQLHEPAGVHLVLCSHGRQLPEDRPHPPARALVAPVAGGAQPPVHHAHRDAAAGALADEVGPHLQLGERDRIGAHRVQEAPHHPGEVERVAHHRVAPPVQRPGALHAGVGGAADHHAGARAKSLDQSPGGRDLAHTDPVDQHGGKVGPAPHPSPNTGCDPRPPGRVPGNGRAGQEPVLGRHVPEARLPVRPPLPGAQRARQQNRAGQERAGQVEDVVAEHPGDLGVLKGLSLPVANPRYRVAGR